MKDTDETHKLTETIYKGLTDNFTPGVRQIILAGKVYHKALVGVAAAARTYNEVLLRVGQTARTTCKGGTEDIGEAIYQIAEAQKEIQSRIEENSKALFSELILPLEQRLENDFKRSSAQHRRYTQGHKAVISPYVKASDNLKKFRKKTKNKVVYDDQKEAHYINALERCHEKLYEYRVQGLKLALLEDRKCHCFLLDRLSAVAYLYANHHKQSADTLLAGLPQWKQLSSRPQILPPEAERFLYQTKEEVGNGSVYWGNGHLPDETRSLGSPYRRSNSAHDMQRRPVSEYASPESFYAGNFGAKTMPHSRGISVPPAAPPGTMQVRAIYSHVGEGDKKLSFTEGDLINVIGEPAEGWQYGVNTRSGQYGWFPMSFTEPTVSPPREPPPQLNGRVKSMGDLLDNRSLSDHGDFLMDDVPGRTSRPKSMYEGSNLRLVNATNQLQQRGHNMGHSAPSPPLPPPPPPITTSSNPATSLATLFSASRLPSPALSRKPSFHAPSHGTAVPPAPSHGTAIPPAPPIPTAPPPPPLPGAQSKSSVISQNGAAYSNRQQMSQPPPAPPPPPPGPGPKMAPPSTPVADYNHTEEDSAKFKKNPKFAGIQLRKTETKDRSAPKI
ncbi:BAR/IMD domain-containing adapter protein 2-like isoform X3 [Mytilus galloprovincialis]|uniref:BAR/IMD domain-containing adapter protein 2-like isoform X3 n=1 Tax=Mytilus galloprovincialis TaxID=29158 RepID=UPI003F7CCAA9